MGQGNILIFQMLKSVQLYIHRWNLHVSTSVSVTKDKNKDAAIWLKALKNEWKHHLAPF